MGIIKKYIIPAAAAIITFLIFFCFRTLPVSKLWKGYSVLIAPVESDNSTIDRVLTAAGCKDFIYEGNQIVPKFQNFAPVLSLDDYDPYVDSKKIFFFDKSMHSKLFYIPESCKSDALKAIGILKNEYNIFVSLDANSSFPWIMPVISFLLFIIFLMLSKNRLVYACASVFSVFFAFSSPFCLNVAGICIVLYCFYLTQKIWDRSRALDYIMNNIFIMATFITPLLIITVASPRNGLFYLLNMAASLSLLYILWNLEKDADAKRSFHPIYIRSAYNMQAINNKSMRNILFSVAGISILMVNVLFSADLVSASNKGELLLPSPAKYDPAIPHDFPTIDDYVIWNWNTVTKPYRRIGDVYPDVPNEGDKIIYPRYELTENGFKPYDEVLFTFDEEFRSDAIAGIDSLEYPAIEKMLKSQSMPYSVIYTSGSREKVNRIGLILLILSLLIPLSIAVYYILISKKKNYVY